MTDKEKIRAEIERTIKWEKEQAAHSYGNVCLLHECREDMCKKFLSFIDSMQEEPVSGLDNDDMPIERWKQAVEAASNQRNYRSSKGLTETRDDYFVDGVQWADEHPKEEPVSEDLDIAAIEYSSQNKFFLKPTDVLALDSLSCCAKDSFIIGANWQKQQIMKEAVDGLVVCDELTHGYKDIAMHIPDSLEVGDKVKLIIIKED